jgi:hypothetical protein
LNLYQESLPKHGVEEIDDISFYQRYRAHLSYAFEAMIVTLAVGGMMEHSSNIELIKRTSAAISDHDSLVALSVGS